MATPVAPQYNGFPQSTFPIDAGTGKVLVGTRSTIGPLDVYGAANRLTLVRSSAVSGMGRELTIDITGDPVTELYVTGIANANNTITGGAIDSFSVDEVPAQTTLYDITFPQAVSQIIITNELSTDGGETSQFTVEAYV